jgi:hypothetical protein
MNLRQLVEKYLQVGGSYGKAVPLGSFGLSRAETERIFGIFDEDYHISRFFYLTKLTGETYEINGFPQTHISIDPRIETIL